MCKIIQVLPTYDANVGTSTNTFTTTKHMYSCRVPPQYDFFSTHLVVHEDVDDWVNDCAELGQDRGDDAGGRGHQARTPECGHQSHDPVGQPAQQVGHHHGDHHQQHTLLPLTADGRVDAAHLQNRRKMERRSGEEEEMKEKGMGGGEGDERERNKNEKGNVTEAILENDIT